MARLTKPCGNGTYTAPAQTVQQTAAGLEGEAITRLGLFEDFAQELWQEQKELAAELEKMRAEGKKNSVKFREMLGKKVMGSSTLLQLRMHGLELFAQEGQ